MRLRRCGGRRVISSPSFALALVTPRSGTAARLDRASRDRCAPCIGRGRVSHYLNETRRDELHPSTVDSPLPGRACPLPCLIDAWESGDGRAHGGGDERGIDASSVLMTCTRRRVM